MYGKITSLLSVFWVLVPSRESRLLLHPPLLLSSFVFWFWSVPLEGDFLFTAYSNTFVFPVLPQGFSILQQVQSLWLGCSLLGFRQFFFK